MLDKEMWRYICNTFDKWCNYEEVANMTYEEAYTYIKNMAVWVPM